MWMKLFYTCNRNLGKPNFKLPTSSKSKEMHILSGTKIMHDFGNEGLSVETVDTKISYVKPHQATFHFKGLWKTIILVKTKNFISMQTKMAPLFEVYN